MTVMQRSSEMLMKGKTVVITGGTSGIGEVAAEKLAKLGARIVLVARDKSRASATLTRLGKQGPGLLTPFTMPTSCAWPR
jgi:NAD(P)-dependent dehydrogenase (short-subunit alcohol dehydrogenase family)